MCVTHSAGGSCAEAAEKPMCVAKQTSAETKTQAADKQRRMLFMHKRMSTNSRTPTAISSS